LEFAKGRFVVARDLTPIVKRSRREGVALHPKAYKIMARRKNAPVHAVSKRRTKISKYGQQLREKQKLKRFYGLQERQFSKLVSTASKQPGVAGETLLQLLELRIDNAIYRLGLAPSRQAARQTVSHGHVLLNGKKVDIPSIVLKVGDTVEMRAKSLKSDHFKQIAEQLKEDSPQVGWLNYNAAKNKATVASLPTREDAEPEVNEQLVIEYYSR
jgi:small subunit ribosomal protein S4